MRVETRLFGEIDIAEEKIITLGRGLIGYPDMKRFTLIFDEEKQGKIMWLQSLDEPQFAMPGRRSGGHLRGTTIRPSMMNF